MIRNDEKGFGALEVVMAVVIVGLLGAVVYLFVANQNADPPKTETNTSSSTTKKMPEPQPSPSNTPDVATVKKTINDFYGKYWSAIKSFDSAAIDAAVAEYGSAKFVSYYKRAMNSSEGVGGDPVMCVNNLTDKAPNVTNITTSDASATATVAITDAYTIKVTTIDENGPKIDSVTCSAS